MNTLLLLIWILPLVFASLARLDAIRWLLPLAAVPALLAAAVLPVGSTLSLPWLLLGVELGLDYTGRVFLLFSALLWLAAGLFTRDMAHQPGQVRFRVFFLLAMAGNLGLIVARDMVSFYLGFTLMGLATYGLVAHASSMRARFAARRYLIWTIVGELMLFTAIVLLVAQQGGRAGFDGLLNSPHPPLATLLLILGFGIKLALPGLHFWLPQAYAVAPSPAVAVMSGVMIKAGLLGWLRFLPPGDAGLIPWGFGLIAMGTVAIVLGVMFGLIQRKPRRVLAYSSISKMGLLTLGMGSTLAWPGNAPVVIAALFVFAAHHAMVKTTLFLGLGLVETRGLRPWLLAGLGFLALTLAGAPLSSGALAKTMLSTSLTEQAPLLLVVLGVSALGTTLLMSRFIYLVWKQYTMTTAAIPALSRWTWLVLLTLIAITPLAYAPADTLTSDGLYLLTGMVLAGLVIWSGLSVCDRLPGRTLRLSALRLAIHSGRRSLAAVNQMGECLQQQTPSVIQNLLKTPIRWVQAGQQLFLQIHSRDNPWPVSGALLLGIGGLLLLTLLSSD